MILRPTESPQHGVRHKTQQKNKRTECRDMHDVRRNSDAGAVGLGAP